MAASPPQIPAEGAAEETPAEEIVEINPFSGNVEVLDTLIKLLEEEEKKA